jgi:hypothetical protein
LAAKQADEQEQEKIFTSFIPFRIIIIFDVSLAIPIYQMMGTGPSSSLDCELLFSPPLIATVAALRIIGADTMTHFY